MSTQASGQGRIPVLDIGAYRASEAGAAAPLAHLRRRPAIFRAAPRGQVLTLNFAHRQAGGGDYAG